MYRIFIGAFLCGAISILIGTPVFVSTAYAASEQREEIVVTARRKEENLQDVPMSVTSIGAQEIEYRGINNVDDVAFLDPSIVIDRGFTAEDTRITVRGLSNTRGRSNVAFIVDGVDVTSEAIGTGGSSLLVNQRLLTDIERIETVKGPQSALYGRAAFAGAISYVTKNANLEKFESNAGIQIADYGLYQLSAGISGPIIDNELGVSLQAVTWDSDSFYDNAASGQNFGGSEGWGVSLTTNYEPTDVLSVKWRVSYSDDTTGPPAQYVFRGDDLVELPLPAEALESNGGPIPDGTMVFDVASLGSAGERQAFASEDPITGDEYEGSQLQLFRTSLGLGWDVGRGTFSSITGFTNADSAMAQDVDYQGLGRPDAIPNNFEVDTKTTTRQLSQEFRYATDLDSPVNYTVGVLGWMETRDRLDRSYLVTCQYLLDPLCDPGNWQAVIRAADIQYGDAGFSEPKTDHWSLYGLIDWELSDQLTIALEGRYSNENFELSRTIGTLCTVAFASSPCQQIKDNNTFSGSIRSDFFTPKLTVEYLAGENAMVYFSAGKGQKPAGLNTLTTSLRRYEELVFDSEKMWSYEAGWKTTLDNDLGGFVFNGAVFFQDYADKQVYITVFDPILGLVPSIENASSAEVFGQELQLVYAPPIDGLSLSLAYTHLDTEYTDYVTNSTSPGTIAEVGNCTAIQVPDDPDDPSSTHSECQVDYSGNELEKAPEHALFATIDLIRPLFDTGMEYLVQFDANYSSDRYAYSSNFTVVDDRWIANLRIGVQMDRWSVVAFADNLFDDDTIISGGTATPDFGAGFAIPPVIQSSSQLPAPRVIGVRANFQFGG